MTGVLSSIADFAGVDLNDMFSTKKDLALCGGAFLAAASITLGAL